MLLRGMTITRTWRLKRFLRSRRLLPALAKVENRATYPSITAVVTDPTMPRSALHAASWTSGYHPHNHRACKQGNNNHRAYKQGRGRERAVCQCHGQSIYLQVEYQLVTSLPTALPFNPAASSLLAYSLPTA